MAAGLCLAAVLLCLLSCPAPALAGTSLDDLLVEARFEFLDENYDRALEVVDRGLASAPHDLRLILLKVDILEQADRRGQAIAFLHKIIEDDPKGMAFLRFDLSYLYLRNQEPQAALGQLAAAEAVDRERAIGDQARVLLGERRYQDALNTLKRLAEVTPESRYMRAQALLYLGEYDKSKAEVQKALAESPSPSLAGNLRSLEKQEEAIRHSNRPFRGWLTFELRYNDNLYADPLQDNPSLFPTRQKDDFAWRTSLDLEYRLWQQGGQWLALTGGILDVMQFELSEASYSGWRAGGYWTRQYKEWGIRVPYLFAYYYSGSSRQRRVRDHSLAPSIYWQMTPTLRTEVRGLIERREYLTSEPNAWHWNLGATHYWLVDGWRRYLMLGYQVDQELAADDKNGYTYYYAYIGGSIELVQGLYLDAQGGYGGYVYDDRPEPFLIGEKGLAGATMTRRDQVLRAQVRLIYRYSESYLFTLGYYFTDNDSNVEMDDGFDPYRFQQNIVALSGTWSF